MTLTGVVYGAGGGVLEQAFEVSELEVLEGVAWMRCPECRANPAGFELPDDHRVPCNHCKGRLIVPVSC